MTSSLPTTDITIPDGWLAAMGAERVLCVVVEGEPKPKPRPRFANGHAHSSREQRQAERDLAWNIRELYDDAPLEGDLALVCLFYRKTKRRVDADNLEKLAWDASIGVLWRDDSQIKAHATLVVLGNAQPRTVLAVGRWKEDV